MNKYKADNIKERYSVPVYLIRFLTILAIVCLLSFGIGLCQVKTPIVSPTQENLTSIEKPSIMILTTGGTIASVKTDTGYRPAYTPPEILSFVPELKNMANLEGRLILSLDSTNMYPQDWITIGEEIKKVCDEGKHQGIVILHGTDTMAYTASALSFMIKDPAIPIVLTGAQVSIGEKGSDAPQNMMNAVQWASYGDPGVYIVAGGRVIKGIHATKTHTTSVTTFQSINYPPVALFDENNRIQIIHPFAPIEDIGKTPIEDKTKGKNKKTIYDFNIDPQVIMVRLTPGFKPEWLKVYCNKDLVHGIIIQGFGTGNIPNRAPYNLLPVLEELGKEGIPVVVLSQCPEGGVDMGIYEVGVMAERVGLIPGGTMTKEACLTKLMWILGKTRNLKEIKKMMKESLHHN